MRQLQKILSSGKVNILGKTFSVKIKELEDCNEFGNAVLGKLQINIHKTLNATQACETLLHEIIHMIDMDMQLGLDERKVSSLSAVLYDTLTRN